MLCLGLGLGLGLIVVLVSCEVWQVPVVCSSLKSLNLSVGISSPSLHMWECSMFKMVKVGHTPKEHIWGAHLLYIGR